ncbi:hypothetical protein SEUCBS139899_000908 [Sporothrix eucalyptigena]|uniref:Uncharacterized protein n=1 Tax=Sporothrix eucalyptigena TaxID=1812306 RepID=A0ABP0BJ25_9PEZI
MPPSLKPRLWKTVQNTIPELKSDNDPSNRAANLSLAEKDGVVRQQLTLAAYPYLDATALVAGGVCESIKTADNTLRLLRIYGYVLGAPDHNDAPPLNSRSATVAFTVPSMSVASLPTGQTVNTVFIDKNLPGRMAHLSTEAQRRLVRLLFFWEAECRRWQELCEEEEDLEHSLAEDEAASKDDHRQVLLERVQQRKRLLPSQRPDAEGATGATDVTGATSPPPSFVAGPSRTSTTPAYEDEPPPPYPGLS